MRGFYFITDTSLSRRGIESDVRNALKAKVEVVQYRDKYASVQEMYRQASILRRICKRALFLINDRVDIALAVNADGVHLGQDDLPYKICRKILGKNKIIGVTAHSLEEARQAQKNGADYVGVSPIFSTSTKQDAGKPVGVDLIKKIKKHLSIPIIAIGGIDIYNAPRVIRAGADCLCAISAVVTKPDVRREIEKFQRLFKT